jgi:hypothetical protein
VAELGGVSALSPRQREEVIETVLRQVAYDPVVTERDVGERLGRLHTGVRARRDSVQELEGRLGEGLERVLEGGGVAPDPG